MAKKTRSKAKPKAKAKAKLKLKPKAKTKARVGLKAKTRRQAKAAPATSAASAAGPLSGALLDDLHAVVRSRKGADPAVSHSARLLSRGTAKVAQKFGEEAVEAMIEAVRGDRAQLVAESADVLYHLLVVWVDAGVRPAQVWAELARRQGRSGIAEKAARRPVALKVPTNGSRKLW